MDQRAFKLYGITEISKEKMALIYYGRLSDSNKHRLVQEGEIVYDTGEGHKLFQVLDIGREAVTLKADGDSFEINLYGHERQRAQTSDSSGTSIFIGGTQASQEQAPEEDPGNTITPQEEQSQEE